ncbi:MAG: aldehyde dehydrogenase family protein [Burkholderiales bacterium]|nr:aldehyde dehydrogenase family protein [Burkholderiales bacterium]
MKTWDSHYIGGRWIKAQAQATFSVHDSSTEEVFATVPTGTAAEAESAVRAARAAFDGWAALPVAERADALDRIAAGLKARTDELAQTIAREVGMPLKLARAVQVGSPIWNFGNFAKLTRAFEWQERVGHSLVLREPVGVVGCITPWNFPLNQIALKVAPALAAGCTVVLKPSEVAPINALILAEVIDEAGLPPGVFNLVNGSGPEVGEVLATHPEVDMVSFTGSTRAGRRVSELASQTIKRVALELGGKSASVVLPDADLEAAIKGSVSACLLNSGQTCSAHTRLLVPEDRLPEVKELLRTAVARLPIGPSLEEGSKLGPLVSAAQRDRVLALVRQGLAEGAELIAGGPDAAVPERGYFVQPTVLRVKPGDTLAREEIFGPVLVVLTYRDEDDAARIANDTPYGLGGGVWSRDEDHAIAFARRMRTGQVDINGAPFNGQAPFGGYKQSGNGRENGRYGLEEFLEYKSLQLRTAGA